MDKQKQIEEMAKDIVRSAGQGVYEKAEYFYNAGYRKVPENAVVLEEFESFGGIEDLLTEFDEIGFAPTTLHPYPNAYASNWKLRLAWAIGEVRKETAEKFAKMAKGAFFGINCITFDEWNWYHDKLDEICKEIAEGGKYDRRTVQNNSGRQSK